MNDNFEIRPNYQINPKPTYCDDTYIDRLYQPEVYTRALAKMTQVGATTLIDVGCGQGHKLLPLTCKIVGIDYGMNLEVCRKNMPQHQWIECDLETQIPSIHYQTLRKSVVICADVIEHLIDPTCLLKALANFSKHAPVVISTPERLTVYGYDQSGPPDNPGHVREWSHGEFHRLLERYFLIEEESLTQADNVRSMPQTLTVVLKGL